MTSEQGRMRPTVRNPRTLESIASAFTLVSDPSAADVEVTGLAVGSADVLPGDLFVALTGLTSHGARYVAAAVESGAVAVLTDPAGARIVEQAAADGGPDLPVLVLPDAADARRTLGALSAWFYDDPAERLLTVGVTGTNGKTTTTYLVDAALRQMHGTTAVVGTIELRIGDRSIESPRTTVEAPVLHGILDLALEEGTTALTMEVSSHALALQRVAGMRFDVVAFTNLQRDHLDFHGDMEGYYRDKARLFSPELAARGVVCVDDEWGARLAREATIRVDTLSTRPGTPASATADWRVTSATVGLDGVGSTFVLEGPDGQSVTGRSPLPGEVNVSNAALALVVAARAGVPLEDAAQGVAVAAAVPGRMERVVEREDGGPLVLVDYAHTPDALELALSGVRAITPGRLVIVFGSDGDRDTGKRPIMGEIAARLADVLVVTDENPRSEAPESIRAAILEGVRTVRPDLDRVHEVAPRSAAVAYGVSLAGDGDTVIVTGKGHEPTQEVAGVFHRYNDRDAVRDAWATRAGAVAGASGTQRETERDE
ncbi:UDP-N-acetylmuramoyl-L-alanyl-D-glutamate--2,6-diaminopimelate ligase [Sanguibacter suaedae]|uniref:UDP-N-acetylmuramyl-tripeptide synthetase n=1 Tax=Sanguibacter suaedae TaxID=2795737 RepID=A0A934ME87_9MICO|nr:UDP-N-acetylmuramoyl-L-alanyl-D-glutamate--2,6-diaminopimelate ligase [Sanguibacter suaedae]MBI9115469.1 UDP-N-acetylmuramoyl-L-alanyl-D-glutamate--2,6-diaminopimelate ligase [Sanguibacter suaedae]